MLFLSDSCWKYFHIRHFDVCKVDLQCKQEFLQNLIQNISYENNPSKEYKFDQFGMTSLKKTIFFFREFETEKFLIKSKKLRVTYFFQVR
jgi:hypothetical protein